MRGKYAAMMKGTVCIAAVLALAGCAKIPDRLLSPHMRVDTEIKDNRVVYGLTIYAGLQNDNSDLVLKNCRGEIVLGDSGTSFTFPFEAPLVFPFETFVLAIARKGEESELAPLFEMLNIDRDEVVKRGSSDEINIEKNYIRVKSISCDHESIFSLMEKDARKGEQGK